MNAFKHTAFMLFCIGALAAVSVVSPPVGSAAPVPRPDGKRRPLEIPADAGKRQCLFTLLEPKLKVPTLKAPKPKVSRELILHTSIAPEHKVFYPQSILERIEDHFHHAELTGKEFAALADIVAECTDDLRGKPPEDSILKVSVAWESKGETGLSVRHVTLVEVPRFVRAIHALAKGANDESAKGVRAVIISPLAVKILIQIDD